LIIIDGKSLSIPAIIAASRYGVYIRLDSSLAIKDRVKKSVDVVKEKLTSGKSLYGISTGFGGSGKSPAPFLSLSLNMMDASM
jgi:phenylalanine ammonia-lyase